MASNFIDPLFHSFYYMQSVCLVDVRNTTDITTG